MKKYHSKPTWTAVKPGIFRQFPEAKDIFIESFRQNFPDLTAGRNIVVLDFTEFKADPADDKSKRDHCGLHPEIMETLLSDEKAFVENMRGVTGFKPSFLVTKIDFNSILPCY